MPELDQSRRHGLTRRLASGGTIAAALVFLFSGVVSFAVSITVGVLLVVYGLLVLAVGVAGWRGVPLTAGAMAFLALLHLFVSLSMVDADRSFWVLAVVSVVALVAAVRLHMGGPQEPGQG